MSADVLRRLSAALHEKIPLTGFLGVEIDFFERDRVVLRAPLGPSLNHRGTAFGPGVFAVAALAPWLLLVRRAWTERMAAQLLLRSSEFAIRRPIAAAYCARCEWLPALDAEALCRNGKARLSATSEVVFDDGAPAATYTAHFTVVGAAISDGAAAGDLDLPFPEAWRS
ncbi:MAG: thioesterase domain-containing protein [Polyangiaceae bacterium]|jgi:thioesterase domain-containing protein|nr:thioesterase domain-containing protein [Polyangiaceae bacterium]